MSGQPDVRIPPYLGRVLDPEGVAVGTCFQVAPGLLVTAWHVLDDLGAGEVDAEVRVDALAGGLPVRTARVLRVSPERDLAVLRAGEPLRGTISALSLTDAVKLRTGVVITGVALVDDLAHEYGFLEASGTWEGGTTRDRQVPLGRLASSAVARGMSGGPVRRLADDAVIGVVSARYNSVDGWLRDSVWVARVEDLRPLLEGLAEVPLTGQPKGRTVGPGLVAAAVAVVIVLTVAITFGVRALVRPAAENAFEPNPDVATPLIIDPVPPLQRLEGDPYFVLPERLDMSQEELARFRREVFPNSEAFAAWWARHNATPLGFGWTKLVLRGNSRDPVRVTNLQVIKDCRDPLSGSYFAAQTEGEVKNTASLGINLDAPSPVAQELVHTASGPRLVPGNYFAGRSVEVQPGGTEELIVAAQTQRQHCTFRLQLVLSTKDGQVTQEVTANGKPFELTAKARPADGKPELSGYQAAYVGREYKGFQKVDPQTFGK